VDVFERDLAIADKLEAALRSTRPDDQLAAAVRDWLGLR
jgi:hypothetical protein